ncbi:MAG TPA: hypothetical protein VGX92_21720 [Pyrinomonadaceae bacterium]|jgi:hypothetical protein|nr:hypothetical protein [Pyrinomonadaceae bacterium]
MLTEVLRPARYNTPVAALTLDGLGICHFNPDSKEWQVAFLRKGHRLAIGVKQVSLEGRIIRSFTPIEVDSSVERLRLTVDNPSEVHLGADEFPDGFFKAQPNFTIEDRKTKDDSYDYRWVVDLINEVPHQFNRLLRKSERPREDQVTILSIPNALFYTQRVTADSVLLAPEPKGPDDPESFVFGRTNELIGAALYSTQQSAGVTLVNEATNEPPPGLPEMPAGAGRLHEISIFNLDGRAGGKLGPRPRDLIGNYVPGDLDLYYTVIDAAPRHQLFAPPRSGPRAIDGDCHLGGSGHSSSGSLPNFDLMTLIQS